MADLSNTLRVFCIGTVDTKLDELRYLSDSVRSNLSQFSRDSKFKVLSDVLNIYADNLLPVTVFGGLNKNKKLLISNFI